MRVRYLGAIMGIIAAFIVGLSALTGCEGGQGADIIVTGYAQYDWVRVLLGDNPADLTVKYLLDSGVNLHNYQPSVRDIMAVGRCKLFIYTDSDAEGWVSSALKNPQNTERKALNLMSLLDKEERLVLDEDSGHEHTEDCEHEYDEHIWLSLKLAEKYITAIAERLKEIDQENMDIYESNAQAYIAELQALDTEYTDLISGYQVRKVLIADRHPFGYLMRDYEIEVMAAFSGCAADTEISFQRVAELRAFFNDNQLQAVLILENSDERLARQVIEDKAAEILTLNSMQSVKKSQLDRGYLEIMRGNLAVLNTALGGL